jgi:hypothetical protein
MKNNDAELPNMQFNIQTRSDKSKHIQDIQGRQLETYILHEFRSFNSETQIQADHHQMVTLLV